MKILKINQKRAVVGILAVVLLVIGFISETYFLKNSAISEVKAADPTSPAVCPNFGLIGYWSFNDGSGNTLTDNSGNNKNGTWNGTGTHWTAGKFEGAGSFTGANDSINISSPYTFGTNSTTVSFWVKATTDNIGKVFNISAAGGAATNSIMIGNNSTSALTNELITFTRLNSTHSGNSVLGYTTPLRAELFNGNWHHVAMTFSGTFNGTKIYIDGVSKTVSKSGSDEGVFQPGNGAQLVSLATIGSMQNGTLLDEVRVYNRALTASDISSIYGTGQGCVVPVSSTGLVGYWSFDDGSGNVVKDSSGNGKNGTWNGTGTHWIAGKVEGAGSFNGSNDSINVASPASFGVNAATVSFWVKGTTDNAGTVLSLGNVGGFAGIKIGQNSDATLTNELIAFRRLNNAHTGAHALGYTSANRTELFDGQWHLVTMTFTGSTGGTKIYLDGVSKNVTFGVGGDEGKFQGGTGLGATSLTLGISGDRTDLLKTSTSLDEVRVYNRALSATEVKQLAVAPFI